MFLISAWLRTIFSTTFRGNQLPAAAKGYIPLTSYLNLRLGVWGGIDGAELAIEVLEVTRLADHGCVVGGIGEWRDMHRPTMALAQIDQRIAQTAIRTYTACYRYLVDLQVFGSTL